ncbi:porin [Capnocytophaga leadbetteri]|uniref:porin n=1 Tax=Capnocytophaga leadbetteri TaxID=327575 RepID=UPI0028E6F049|nr:porin [Capnocytophaga leadbetteri]
MKKILLAMSFLVGGVAFAQQDLQEQINQLRMEIDQLRMAPPPPPMEMPVPPEEMESPLRKKFNMYFNFQTSLDAEKVGKNDLTTKFQVRQLRLEVRGDLTERIFYRFRHRLNKPNAAASLDNLATATDMMYAGFRLNEKWTATVGKMCQMWGGYEFDLNPMNIYECSDFLNNMDNFMLGAMITYTPNPNHEFNLQITDVRNDSFENIYGTSTGIKASNAPLAYIFNWNGNLFDSLIQTRWGAGLQSEADGYTNALVMLGTKLNLPKFQVFLDYMMANDQLDRLCYTPNSKDSNKKILGIKDAKYNSFVLKAEYQPAPEWNIFAQGLYETANSSLANNEFKGLGYFAGVEYLPFKEQDLRFFLAYIGRSRDVNNAKVDTNRVSVGMMYRIKAF